MQTQKTLGAVFHDKSSGWERDGGEERVKSHSRPFPWAFCRTRSTIYDSPHFQCTFVQHTWPRSISICVHSHARVQIYIALTCICKEKQFFMTHRATDNTEFAWTRIYAMRKYSSIRFRFFVKRWSNTAAKTPCKANLNTRYNIFIIGCTSQKSTCSSVFKPKGIIKK